MDLLEYQGKQLLARHGLSVRQVHGYSYLPYRRDGSRQVLPGLRRRIEERLARVDTIAGWGSCFILVAEHTATDWSRGAAGEGS